MNISVFQFDQLFNPYIKYCLEHVNSVSYVKMKNQENELFKTYIVVSIPLSLYFHLFFKRRKFDVKMIRIKEKAEIEVKEHYELCMLEFYEWASSSFETVRGRIDRMFSSSSCLMLTKKVLSDTLRT